MVAILPATPRYPNPPGITIPSTPSNTFERSGFSSSSFSESIQRIFIFLPYSYPACEPILLLQQTGTHHEVPRTCLQVQFPRFPLQI